MYLRLAAALLLCAGASAAERLPDMRWIFERALCLDGRADVHRFDRVRAWALVPLLYPDDEPGTENDEVWRLVARDALRRLDASAAGYPPPREPLPTSPAPADPFAALPGLVVEAAPLGGVAVRATGPGLGLLPGDRILAADGHALQTVADLVDAVATALRNGGMSLQLDGGRGIELLLGGDAPARLAGLRLAGEQQPWDPPRLWRLPACEGLWLLSGTGEAEIAGRAPRAAPGARHWTALAEGGAALRLRGRHELHASPLSGPWRPATPRLILGVRAGQGLVVESRGPAHLLSLLGPDGREWAGGAAAGTHRVVRHGPAGAMAAEAIERNGMLAISVAPADGVRLRILGEPTAGDPRP